MSLNWKEIDLILSELRLSGCFIQKVRQPDFASLVLEIFRPGGEKPPAGEFAAGRFQLLVSLEQKKTRLHAIRNSPPKDNTTLQRFAQLLRSRITGGRIEEAGQLGDDRIVKLLVRRGGEATGLWIRLWGGAANIIACAADGTILDAFYRRPKRNEVSGCRYTPEDADRRTAARTYEIREIPGEESFNERIERFYARESSSERAEQLRSEAIAAVTRELRKLSSRLRTAERNTDEAENFESLQQYGDLIMSNLHAISAGSDSLECENFYTGGAVDIPLNPSLPPQRNAQEYYDKYKKDKARYEHEHRRVESLRREMAELERRKDDLEAMDDADEQEVIRLAEGIDSAGASASGGTAGRKTGGATRAAPDAVPGLRYRSGEFIILVGRTAAENDELLRRHVKGNDWWLHTRDFPGGYVFIKAIPGKSVPLDNLLDAGNLALFYSKGRSGGKGELYYTQVKYLRRAKDGKRGLVLPTREKNLSIVLDRKRLDRLFDAAS